MIKISHLFSMAVIPMYNCHNALHSEILYASIVVFAVYFRCLLNPVDDDDLGFFFSGPLSSPIWT